MLCVLLSISVRIADVDGFALFSPSLSLYWCFRALICDVQYHSPNKLFPFYKRACITNAVAFDGSTLSGELNFFRDSLSTTSSFHFLSRKNLRRRWIFQLTSMILNKYDNGKVSSSSSSSSFLTAMALHILFQWHSHVTLKLKRQSNKMNNAARLFLLVSPLLSHLLIEKA